MNVSIGSAGIFKLGHREVRLESGLEPEVRKDKTWCQPCHLLCDLRQVTEPL